MSFGKGSNTTTTQTTPNPAAMGAYNALLGMGADTFGQNPWQNYGGEFVAPVNAQQYGGIGNINRYAESAQPAIGTAEGLALSGATPISAGDIQNYYNPWQSSVVGASEAQFANTNAQQQQQVLGNAAMQGALGGDRVGVAQANLAGQQQLSEAPVIAGLESQGFNQAAQLALAAKQQQAQGAYSLGNLGVAGQQAALSGASAQTQAGTLEQQTQQQLDAARYNEFLMSRAFPYQQMQWLAGLDTGVGSQMGGTSSTTGPPPSLLASLLGLGTAGVGAAGQAGMFKPSAARGGRIGFAAGGDTGVGAPLFGGVGYMPDITITKGAGAPKPPEAFKATPPPGGDKSPFQPWMFKGPGSTDANAGISPDPTTGSYAPEAGFGEGPIYRDGGAIRLPHGFDAGGPVTSAGFGTGSFLPRWRGYDEGGEVRLFAEPEAQRDYMPNLPLTGGPGPPHPPKPQSPSGGGGLSIPWGSIASGIGSALGGIGSAAGSALGGGEAAGEAGAMLAVLGRGGRIRGYDDGGEVIELPPDEVPTEVPPEAMARWRAGVDADVTAGASPQPVAGVGAPELPPEITGGASRPPAAGAPLALGYDTPPAAAGVGAPAPTAAPAKGGFKTENLWPSLMAAGFGMMASRSPFPGVAIGEGGMQGLHTYQTLTQQQQQQMEHERTFGLNKQRVDLEAKRLMQQADTAQKNLELHTKQFEETTRQHGVGEKLAREQFEFQKGKTEAPFGWTKSDDGKLVPTPGGPHDPETIRAETGAKEKQFGWTEKPDGSLVPTPGGPHDPEYVQKTSIAKAGAGLFSPETVDTLARQALTGDKSVFTNLGRGVQGPMNIVAVRERMNQIMREEGKSGPDIAAANANFAANVGAARVSAQRAAQVEFAVEEAKNTFPLALAASAALPRTSFVPWNKAVQMVQSGTSSPELARYVTALRGTMTAYSQAMSRTGTNSVHAQQAAEELLRKAASHEEISAVLDQMSKEMEAAKIAPETVRQAILARISGKAPSVPAAPPGGTAPPAAAPAKPATVIQNGHSYNLQPDGTYK